MCRRLARAWGRARQSIKPRGHHAESAAISPQPPIIDPGLVALLPQGPLAFEHRANGLITGSGVRLPNGVMDEEGELRRMGRVAGLSPLYQQRSIQGLSEESL